MKGRIRIVAVPAGEAPQWVRETWVGIELPLALRQAHNVHTFGVLSGPRSFLAALWRLLTVTRKRYFLFREEECRPVDDATRR